MPGGTSFRQTEEKQSSFVIDLMLWSPKMDLIAVTAVTGEVFLFIVFYELFMYHKHLDSLHNSCTINHLLPNVKISSRCCVFIVTGLCGFVVWPCKAFKKMCGMHQHDHFCMHCVYRLFCIGCHSGRRSGRCHLHAKAPLFQH